MKLNPHHNDWATPAHLMISLLGIILLLTRQKKAHPLWRALFFLQIWAAFFVLWLWLDNPPPQERPPA